MTAGQFLLVLLILALILGFLGLPWLAARRRTESAMNPALAYLAAIDALIRGRKFQAMEALRKVARQETDNLLAYLRLGDLVRAMGHPEKAERIHVGLLARPADDPQLVLQVRESLLEDNLVQRKWDEVIRQGEALLSADKKNKKNPAALRALSLAYRERREWEKAFEFLDEWHRSDPKRASPHPAQLRAEVAQIYLQEGRTKEARRLLEEAAKLEGGRPGLAQVLLGDVLAGEGEHEKAIEQWLVLARNDPENAGRIITRLERSFFELGRFGDLLPVYEQLRERNPGSVSVTIALADMHRRRGRADEAVTLLESILASNSRHRRARRLLVSCLLQLRRTDSALRELDVLLDQLSEEEDEPSLHLDSSAPS